MQHNTEIDTVGIQIDCNNSYEQGEVLNGLLGFILKIDTLYLGNKRYKPNKQLDFTKTEYCLYHGRALIATIKTGTYRAKSHFGNSYIIKYFLSVKFAGLKRYNNKLDRVSFLSLVRVTAYLNDREIPFKFTELDICIDVPCKFYHILAICTKKSPKTNYYGLTDIQKYHGETTWIENIDTTKRDKAVLRAYAYDKRYKERLKYDITRFELKLQPKYFNKYGFSLRSIVKALDRYHVMYFKNLEDKHCKISAYNSYGIIRKREIQRLGFDKHRLLPDIRYIKHFLDTIQDVSEFDIEFGLVDIELL